MIILGDISGIQRYLFDVADAGGGQARRLRDSGDRLRNSRIAGKNEQIRRGEFGSCVACPPNRKAALRLDRRTRRFALIDRRWPGEQDANPYVPSEIHWLDSGEGTRNLPTLGDSHDDD